MNVVTGRTDMCSWCGKPLEDAAGEGALGQRHYNGIAFCATCVAAYTDECCWGKRAVILPTSESWVDHLGRRRRRCAWATLAPEALGVRERAALKDDELVNWAQMVAARHPLLDVIYLFGSRVRGYSHDPAHAKHDTDVLVYVQQELKNPQFTQAIRRLFSDTAIGFAGLDLFVSMGDDIYHYCNPMCHPDLDCCNIIFWDEVWPWKDGRDLRVLWEREADPPVAP